MLTRELAIASYDAGQVTPDRLTRKSHAQYLQYADQMLQIYRTGIGQTRRVLHAKVHRVFDQQIDCPGRRILAFCKLLDEVSEFESGDRRKIAQLRKSVFRSAAQVHPLVSQRDDLFGEQEHEVKRRIASEHGMSWPELNDKLFSDLIEYHELKSFQGYPDASALLSRYNVAQTQVILYDAVRLQVRATCDFKRILRYAKLARLMYRLVKTNRGYDFEFGGATSVLHTTHRYGTAMARFLPGLLSCQGWSMIATLRARGFRPPIQFRLDDPCGLTSGILYNQEFDSSLEKKFFEEWGGETREGWCLERETEILHCGQTAFFPDFALVHENGSRVMLEIVGFWTPEYLQEKARVLEQFRHQPILLAISKPLKDRLKVPPELPVVYFKNRLDPVDVLKSASLFGPDDRYGG